MKPEKTAAELSNIVWPARARSGRAGSPWLRATGFNQAITDCQAAYNRHVEVFDASPRATYLIADWPRDESRAHFPQKDYLEGYLAARTLIEDAFTQAQALNTDQATLARRPKP